MPEAPGNQCPACRIEVDGTTVKVAGELDVSVASALARALDVAFAGGAARIVLDLHEVRFLDASCLEVIHAARYTHDGALEVVGARGIVERVFHISGLGSVLTR